MLRVALVTSGYLPVPDVSGGAVESLCTNLLRESSRRGDYEFTVVTCDAEGLDQVERNLPHTRLVRVRTPAILRLVDRCIYALAQSLRPKEKNTGFRFIAQRLWFIRQVRKTLENEIFDRVIVENHPTLLAAFRGRNRGTYANKVIYHAHNEFSMASPYLHWFAWLKGVWGVSSYILDYLDAQLAAHGHAQLRNDQRHVLRNGIDQHPFDVAASTANRAQVRASFGCAAEDQVVLFAGRIVPEKGLDVLIAAVQGLSDRFPRLRLIVAGAAISGVSTRLTAYEEHIRSLAAPVQDRVIFTGYVPHEKIPELAVAADICCVPSLCEDAAPLAVIEALCAARPVVATRRGGIPEYMGDDCGYLIDTDGDVVNELKIALARLLENEELRDECGRQARKRADGFTLDAYYERFEFLNHDVQQNHLENVD